MRLLERLLPTEDASLRRLAGISGLFALAIAAWDIFVPHRLGAPAMWVWLGAASLLMALSLQHRLAWLRWLLLALLVPEALALLLCIFVVPLIPVASITALMQHNSRAAWAFLGYGLLFLLVVTALAWHATLGVRCFGAAGVRATSEPILSPINPLSGAFEENHEERHGAA